MSEITAAKRSNIPLVLTAIVALIGVVSAAVFHSKSRDLQAQLAKATEELNQTKTLLDGVTKEWQLTKTNLARLEASLAGNEKQLAEVARQLNQTSGELKRSQSEVARMQPLAAKALEMPVTATFRQALLGSGYVLSLQNKSAQALRVSVTVSDASKQRTKVFDMVLDAITQTGASKEIGHLEGWTFLTGDYVEIACAGYTSIKANVK